MTKPPIPDMTPLLDVILILLFAILINSGISQEASKSVDREAIEALSRSLNAANIELSASKTALKQVLSAPMTFEDIQKYDALKKKVFIVDVRLKGHENAVTLNEHATGIYLLSDSEKRASQVQQLIKALRAEVQSSAGSNSLTLFTLSEDGAVYRYAYLAAQSALESVVDDLPPGTAFYVELRPQP